MVMPKFSCNDGWTNRSQELRTMHLSLPRTVPTKTVLSRTWRTARLSSELGLMAGPVGPGYDQTLGGELRGEPGPHFGEGDGAYDRVDPSKEEHAAGSP